MPTPADSDINSNRTGRNWWATRGGDWDQGCLGCGTAWWVVIFVVVFLFFIWGWGFPGWGGWGGWGWRHSYNRGGVTAPMQPPGPSQPPGATPR